MSIENVNWFAVYNLIALFMSYYWREGKTPSKKWIKSQYIFSLFYLILKVSVNQPVG